MICSCCNIQKASPPARVPQRPASIPNSAAKTALVQAARSASLADLAGATCIGASANQLVAGLPDGRCQRSFHRLLNWPADLMGVLPEITSGHKQDGVGVILLHEIVPGCCRPPVARRLSKVLIYTLSHARLEWTIVALPWIIPPAARSADSFRNKWRTPAISSLVGFRCRAPRTIALTWARGRQPPTAVFRNRTLAAG
jgi:hypothetical protein